MEFKYGTIIKQDGTIGIAVTDVDKSWHFKPVNTSGSCYYSELPSISPEAIEASHDEKLQYMIDTYSWGEVIKVYEIGDIIIFEDSRDSFHIYIAYKDTSHSASTLDKAIVVALAQKYDGINTRADMYIFRMLGLND